MPPTPDFPAGFPVADYTFEEVAERLAHLPALLVPAGGLGPLRGVPIGTANRVLEALAGAISWQSQLLYSPLLPYGHATPFRCYSGCLGSHYRATAALLNDCIQAAASQGVRTVFLLDGGMESGAVREYLVRKNAALRGRCRVVWLNWAGDGAVRQFIKRNKPSWDGEVYQQSALVSMAQYLGVASTTAFPPGRDTAGPVQGWRKRGRDPEQFFKLFPRGIAVAAPADPVFGGELFCHITARFCEIISADPGVDAGVTD